VKTINKNIVIVPNSVANIPPSISYDGINYNQYPLKYEQISLGFYIFDKIAFQTGRNTTISTVQNSCLSYSYDLKKWHKINLNFGSQNGSINNIIYAISYKKNIYVAVGYTTGQLLSTLAYSKNGINWHQLGTNIFSSYGINICNNGNRFVAFGGGTNSIAWSDDGIVWNGCGNSIFTIARGGFWDGSKFIAFGDAGTYSIAYSYDGINWTGINNTIFTTRGFGGVRGNGISVAVGIGTNYIAWSTDGIIWHGLGNTIFSTRGQSVIYNGKMFVAAGTGTNNLAYSYDGKNWTGLGNNINGANTYNITCQISNEIYDFTNIQI